MDYVWLETPTPFYRDASTAMRGCLVSFFNKYLRNTDDHLLDNPTNRFPAVINFKRKWPPQQNLWVGGGSGSFPRL